MQASGTKGALSRGDLNRCDESGKRLYLTIEDTAIYFHVSKGTVLNWVRKQRLPHRSLGGRVYLHRGIVEEWLACDGWKVADRR